jgi:predicted nucleotidyltransferase
MIEPTDRERLGTIAAGYPLARVVVLFGSVARGTAFPWSDADIGITGLGFWEALELGARMATVLGREPHVVDLEPASDLLRYHVARDGILIREGEPGAWACFRAAAAVRYFDLAPILDICAGGARRRVLREAGRG